MSVTLKDIAVEAGVTTPTVSKVLNASSTSARVGQATRERVMEIARRRGYRANQVARGLRMQRTTSIGLIVSGLTTPVRMRMLERIEQLLLASGYHVFIGTSEGCAEKESQYVKEFLSRQVDGLVIASRGHLTQNSHLERLAKSGVPVVLTEVEVPGLEIAQVVVDIAEGARRATRHLLDQGRRPVLLVPAGDNLSVAQRITGFLQAYTDTGRSASEGRIHRMDVSALGEPASWPRLGLAAAHELVAAYPDLDAVFASSDHVALGLMRGLRQTGRQIPDDVLVVGFDGLIESECYEPPLSTIEQPQDLLAREVVRALSEQLRDAKPSRERVSLVPELIVRESSQVG